MGDGQEVPFHCQHFQNFDLFNVRSSKRKILDDPLCKGRHPNVPNVMLQKKSNDGTPRLNIILQLTDSMCSFIGFACLLNASISWTTREPVTSAMAPYDPRRECGCVHLHKHLLHQRDPHRDIFNLHIMNLPFPAVRARIAHAHHAAVYHLIPTA